MEKGYLVLSETSCYKAHKISNDFGECFVFAKELASLNKHPILLNFKANFTAIRILLGYTDRKFRQLLNLSLSQRLIWMNGDNLHIQGKQADRSLFGRLRNKQEIKQSDIKSFYQIAVLKHNFKKQKHLINSKSSAMTKGRGTGELETEYNLHNRQINEATLAIRNIGRLFKLSVSASYALTKRLKAFGLTLSLNKVSISKDAYEFYKSLMFHNARVSQTGEFYYLKASIPTFSDFYKVDNKKGNRYFDSTYW